MRELVLPVEEGAGVRTDVISDRDFGIVCGHGSGSMTMLQTAWSN